MISHPAALLVVLIGLVIGLQFLGRFPLPSSLFRRLPIPFWCYFIPMLLGTLGVFPPASPVYVWLTTYGLAACLILLLVGIDIRSILKLGPAALSTMAVGILGVMLGAFIGVAAAGRWLPAEAWMGLGALTASWTGGSANMLAVKEALGLSDAAFVPLVIVDTGMTYGWMALMITLAPLQAHWDRWVKADTTLLVPPSPPPSPPGGEGGGEGVKRLAVILFGMAMGWLSLQITPSTVWALLLATTTGIALSFTPVRRLEGWGASHIGSFFLYVLLAAIGARAHLGAILQAPAYLVAALIVGITHAGLLIIWGRWRRLPMFFLVTASQANFGGAASAPIVAGIYRPSLAPVGLLLALSANTIGTYVGLSVALICRYFSS